VQPRHGVARCGGTHACRWARQTLEASRRCRKSARRRYHAGHPSFSRDARRTLTAVHDPQHVYCRAVVAYKVAVRPGRRCSAAVEDFLAVVTAPALGVGALSDFVRLARQKPTSLNFYAVPGAPYLAYLAFQKRAGIETTFVAYNNPTNAMADLSAGPINSAVMPVASVLGAAKAGKIKILAGTNEQRTPAAPDIPTVKEAGYPEFTFGGFLGLFGPKDMPMALREQIASDVRYI